MKSVVLNGHSIYQRAFLEPSLLEEIPLDKILDDMRKGSWIYQARNLEPRNPVLPWTEKHVVGNLTNDDSRWARGLWQLLEFFNQRTNVYAGYASAGECPAPIPDAEHREVGRRISELQNKSERVREIFEEEVRRLFPKIPGTPNLQIIVDAGWTIVEWHPSYNSK